MKPDTTEIAKTSRDAVNQPYGLRLQHNDDTLNTRGGAKGLKLYDELERDAHCFAVIQKRKMAVVAHPWEVEPASESLRDRKCAQEVARQLQLLNIDKLTANLLDSLIKGFAIAEIIWALEGSLIVATQVKIRDQRRFSFDADYHLRLLTLQNQTQGELLPAKKFIHHATGAKDGNPYGLGLGSKLFWPVWFKKQSINFWLTFADKFGQPTALGQYPHGTSEPEQQALLESLAQIATDSAITVPVDTTVQFLEANRPAAGDFYEKLCRYMDEQISICVLGENSTTVGKSAGLGSNQASVHNDVRLELARADADLLSETLNNTLVKWIAEYNFPGAGIPRFWRKIAVAEDLKIRADRDTAIFNMGFKPTLDYITNTYGEGWELADTPAAALPAPNQIEQNNTDTNQNAQAAFSNAGEQSIAPTNFLDDMVNAAANDWQLDLNPMLTPIDLALENAIKAGKTLEQFQAELPDLITQMEGSPLATNVAQRSFFARLLGNAGVKFGQ